MTPRLRRFLPVLVLLPAFLVAYGVNFRTPQVGDSMAHLLQAASLTRDGDYALDEYRPLLKRLAGVELPYYVHECEGHLRSLFNYFPALLLAPAFRLARAVLGSDFECNPIAWGLTGKVVASLMIFVAGGLLWLLLRCRVGTPIALIALLGLWFGSSVWTTTIDYRQHHPMLMFQAAALLVLFGDGATNRRPWFFAGGFLLALSVISRYQTVLSALLVSAGVVVRDRRHPDLPRFFLGGALPLLPTLLYHQAAFGHPLKGEPALPFLTFDQSILKNLVALLFNPNKGLLVHSPWLVFAGAALLWLRPVRDPNPRRVDPLLLTCLLAPLPLVVLYAKMNQWYGGWSWGYRFLTDVLIYLIVLAAFGLSRVWSRRPWRMVSVGLLVVSVVLQALGALTFDYNWHCLNDSGLTPHTHWIWQVRQGQFAYYACRGRVYIGSQPYQLWPNPFAARGLHGIERWPGGQRVRWTAGQGRFLYSARLRSCQLPVFPNPTATAGDGLRITLFPPDAPPIVADLMPNRWNYVPIPSVPFQHARMMRFRVERTWSEGSRPDCRRLGVALPARMALDGD